MGHAARAAGVESGEYTLGAGDVLQLTVWQRQDLGGTVTVDSEGNITLPLIGPIRAAGLSPSKLGEELTRRFSFVDRQVSQVTVSVLEYNSRRVFVMGEVLAPGPYAFARIPGVWAVIREAGGPTALAALSRVRVIPPEGGGPPQLVDLEYALSTGDYSRLPTLRAGSTVLVPRLEAPAAEGQLIYVYGRVRNPGTFSAEAARTALQAILAAGGPTAGASMAHVRVVRPGPVRAQVIEVDLHDYTHRGILYANVPLRPGDTVTVPSSRGFFVWAVAKDVFRLSGEILGTVLFFINFTDNTNSNQGTAAQTPAPAGN